MQLKKRSYRADVCLAVALALLSSSTGPAAAADAPKAATHTLAIDGGLTLATTAGANITAAATAALAGRPVAR